MIRVGARKKKNSMSNVQRFVNGKVPFATVTDHQRAYVKRWLTLDSIALKKGAFETLAAKRKLSAAVMIETEYAMINGAANVNNAVDKFVLDMVASMRDSFDKLMPWALLGPKCVEVYGVVLPPVTFSKYAGYYKSM